MKIKDQIPVMMGDCVIALCTVVAIRTVETEHGTNKDYQVQKVLGPATEEPRWVTETALIHDLNAIAWLKPFIKPLP